MQPPLVTHASEVPWMPGPAPGVWRKPLAPSSWAAGGTHTFLERYDRGVAHARHVQTRGEEILVLDGILSDERGDFSAGSHLLHGQGFCHASRSRDGCLLFVRYGQYRGRERPARCSNLESGTWVSRGFPGAARQWLFQSSAPAGQIWLTRLEPGAQVPTVATPNGEEIFVLEGEFADEFGSHPKHSWLYFRPGSGHTPRTTAGCLLYVAVPDPV